MCAAPFYMTLQDTLQLELYTYFFADRWSFACSFYSLAYHHVSSLFQFRTQLTILPISINNNHYLLIIIFALSRSCSAVFTTAIVLLLGCVFHRHCSLSAISYCRSASPAVSSAPLVVSCLREILFICSSRLSVQSPDNATILIFWQNPEIKDFFLFFSQSSLSDLLIVRVPSIEGDMSVVITTSTSIITNKVVVITMVGVVITGQPSLFRNRWTALQQERNDGLQRPR